MYVERMFASALCAASRFIEVRSCNHWNEKKICEIRSQDILRLFDSRFFFFLRERWAKPKENRSRMRCRVLIATQHDNLHLNRLLYQLPDTWMWRTRDISCARRMSKLLTANEKIRKDGNWISNQIPISHGEIEIHSRRLRVEIPWHWNPCLPKPLKLKMKREMIKIWIHFHSKGEKSSSWHFAAHFPDDFWLGGGTFFIAFSLITYDFAPRYKLLILCRGNFKFQIEHIFISGALCEWRTGLPVEATGGLWTSKSFRRRESFLTFDGGSPTLFTEMHRSLIVYSLSAQAHSTCEL